MIVVKIQDIQDAAKHRPQGYLEDVYVHAKEITEHYAIFTVSDYDQLCSKYRTAYVSIYSQIATYARLAQNTKIYGGKNAPGNVLLRFLNKFGFDVGADCPCRKKIEIINARGYDWAISNISQITGWLEEEANKWAVAPNQNFNEALVRRALEFARRHELPQTQFDVSDRTNLKNNA